MEVIKGSPWKLTERETNGQKQILSINNYRDFIKEHIIKYRTQPYFTPETVDICLTNEQFETINTSKEKYYPLFTLHATSNIDTMNSIIKYGYLLPGELHPVTGRLHDAINGAYYGEGIYTTPDTDEAWNYCRFDQELYIYFIVNIVLIGKIDWINMSKHPKGIIMAMDSLYTDEYHTRILPRTQMVISADPSRVLPVASIRVKTSLSNQKFYLNNAGSLTKLHTFDGVKTDLRIQFSKFFSNYYIVPPIKTSHTYVLRHTIIFPELLFKNPPVTKKLRELLGILGKTKLFVYDKNYSRYTLQVKDALDPILLKHKKPRSVKTQSILPALEDALDRITNENDNTKYLDVVYIFLPEESDEDYQAFVDKWVNFTQVKQIVIKLIQHKPCEKAYYLKNLESYSPFGKFCHSLTDDWVERIIDENSQIKFNQHRLWLPLPQGIYGEGFVSDLTQNPSWDVEYSSSMLYRGSYQKYVYVDNREVYQIEWSDKIDFDQADQALTSLLSRFRNKLIIDPSLFKFYKNTIDVLCQSMIKQLDKEIKINANIASLKHIYYHISSLVSDMKHFARITFDGEWFERLQNMRFAKSIIKRVHVTEEEVYEGMGYGIRVAQTAASEVEPWLLMVTYVSPQKYFLRDMFISSELNETIKDTQKEMVNHVLPDNINKSYLAYVFTNNPKLIINNQAKALLTNSFVNILESLLIDSIKGKINHIDERLYLATSLISRMKWDCQDLSSKTLTEHQGIMSVNMILGKLTCVNAGSFLDDSSFVFSVLAEAVMRSARAYLRISGKTVSAIIRETIDIDNPDLHLAARKTSKFFRQRFSNTTPFAVVSVIEFLKRHNRDSKTIAEDYLTKTISMKSFFQTYLPDALPHETQLALFLQGIYYHKSSQRQNLEFNAKNIINTIIEEQQQIDQIKQQNAVIKQNKKEKRKDRIREELLYCILPHTWPAKVFDYAMIQTMNAKGEDYYERMQTGLLKHHCCYPHCPDYLKNFATDNDKEKGTRNGIMRHLKINYYLLNTYIPGDSVVASKLGHLPKERFAERMLEYFEKIEHRIKGITMNARSEAIEVLWQMYGTSH
jgi:hypothetical protein